MTNYIGNLIKDLFSSSEVKKLRATLQLYIERNKYLENELSAAKIIINSRDTNITNLNKRIDYLENKYIINPEPKKEDYTATSLLPWWKRLTRF